MRPQHLLTLGALLCTSFVAAATAATTVVDDTFADGNRSSQNPPSSVNWFVNTGSGLTQAASAGSFQLNNSSSRLLVGYFTEAGSPVALATGDSITLELFFTSSVAPANVTNGFNFSLFNSASSRLTADFSGTSNSAFTSYDGYGTKSNGLGSTSGSNLTLRRRNAASRSTALMSTSGDWATLATGSGTVSAASAGVNYVATLTVTNNGSTASLNYTLKAADGATTLHSLSGTDSNAGGVLASFDAVALYFQTNEFPSGTLTIQEIRVTTTAGTIAGIAPSFTTQPSSQMVNAGDSVTFTSAASGTPTPTYQWNKNGSALAGATSASLTLNNVQASDAGNYTVVATNSVGSATSSVATLTVVSSGTAPTITTQPSSQTVNAGDTATFTVVADGTAPLSYQWQKDGSAIGGATSATLTLTNVQPSAAGSYSVVVSNPAGSVSSSAATLTVYSAPAIVTPPQPVSTTVGGNATFTVAVSGNPSPTYQWRKDGADIAGATSSTLALTNVQYSDAGSYSVIATNSLGNATSSAATLTVSAPSLLSRYNLTGFATLNGGTTGGGVIPETDAAYVKVSTPLQFANALISAAKTAGSVKVIEIMNDLNLGWNEIGSAVQGLSSNPFRAHATPKLHPALIASGVSLIDIKPKSGLTIFSANGATIRHANFNLKGASNIIIRNLKFDEMWEWDEATKGNYDSNDWDFITLSNGSAVTNVWIDHCTFTKSYDGIVDMKAGTQYVTLSWCKYVGDDGATNSNSFVRQQIAALEANRSSYAFYNFLRNNGFSVEDIVTIIQGHDKGHLMGSNSLDPDNATLSATFHHQWISSLWDRCIPRLRAGNVHNYNLYVDDSSVLAAKRLRDTRAAALTTSLRNTLNNTYSFNPPINGCISTEGGAVLLEKSNYVDCLWPLRNNQTDPSNSVYTGKIMATDTRYVFHNTDGTTTNIRGNSTDPGSPLGPFQAAVIPFSWNGYSSVPYSYTPDDPDDLPAILASGAGAGTVSWSKDNWLKTSYSDPTATAPAITTQPQATTMTAGTSTSFTVVASGTRPLSYQWKKNGQTIAGATDATLSLANLSASDEADYTVVVTNLVGSVTSSSARLSVLLPVAITSAPASQTVTAGDAVSFNVISSGTAPLSYQWSKDGTAIPGATSATLDLGQVLTNATGNYTVTVTNAVNSVTSAAATLVVNKAAASITLSDLSYVYDGSAKTPTVTTAPAGLAASLTYNGSGTAPSHAGDYTIVATIDDANYAGTTSDTLRIAKATPILGWSAPAAITYGTPLGAAQLNASSNVSGAFVYTPAAGTVLPAGANQPLSAVFVPADSANFNGGSIATTITVNKATADVLLGNLAQTYSGSPKSVTVTTSPANLAVDVTYAGSATAPTAAGSYAVVATVNDANYVGSATGTLVIAKADATITLAPLTQAYDGTPKTVIATTVPAGLTVAITYDNGSATGPIYPGAHPVVATINDGNYNATLSETLTITITALVRHAPTLNGIVAGSVQVLSGEAITLNSGAALSGDLLVPGTPTVRLNGNAGYGGTKDATGATTPAGYQITLNGNSLLRYLVRRVDAIALPTVAAPASPAGTRSVSLNRSTDSAGDFATLRDLTLQGNAGRVAVPAGTYGNFTVNGNNTLVLGTAGATEPAVYNLQNLTLNGSSSLEVAGPIVLTLANGTSLNGSAGSALHADWLTVRIASGGLTLNGNALLHGSVVAPNGTITINGNAVLAGSVAADRLTLNGNGELGNEDNN